MKNLFSIFCALTVFSFSCTGSTTSNQKEEDTLEIKEVAQLYETTANESIQALAEALKKNKPDEVKLKLTEVVSTLVSLAESEDQTALASYVVEVCRFIENNAQALNDMGVDAAEIYDAASDAMEMLEDDVKHVIGGGIEKIKSAAGNVVNEGKAKIQESIKKEIEIAKEKLEN